MNLTKKLTYSQAFDFVQDNKATIKKWYDDHTARTIAEKLNVHYDNNFQKALIRVMGGKGMGLGGARTGSGNKKGVKLKKHQ